MLRLLKQYYPIRNVFFILTESLIILASVLFSAWVKGGVESAVFSSEVFVKAFLIASVCQIALYYFDLYDFSEPGNFSDLSLRLLQAIGVATIILSLFYFVFPIITIKTNVFVPSISLSIVFIISGRIVYTKMLDRGMFNQKIIILGSGDLAEDIVAKISEKIDCGYTIACIVLESPEKETLAHHKGAMMFIGDKYDGLFDFARRRGIKEIVVALQEKRGGFPVEELLDCRMGGIDVLDGTTFYETLTGKLLVAGQSGVADFFGRVQENLSRPCPQTVHGHFVFGDTADIEPAHYRGGFIDDQTGFQGRHRLFSGTRREAEEAFQYL